MHTQCAAPPFGQYREIATRLRGFHNAKRIFLSRHRKIDSVVASDLQKNTTVGAALVSLSRGMQEARTKTEHRGDFFPVTNGKAYALHGLLVGVIHGDVAEHREVIAGAQPAEMRFQNFREPRFSF